MDGLNTPLQLQADAMRDFLDHVDAISRDAANEDADGTWGLDAWIRVIHNLIDAQVKAYANVLQTAIGGGPWWFQPLGEPWASEPIKVPPVSVHRKFEIVESFVRMGTKTKIPDYCIRFIPDFLPGGVTQFRIALKDYRFIGANYSGTIRLSAMTPDPGAPPDLVCTVTVGL